MNTPGEDFDRAMQRIESSLERLDALPESLEQQIARELVSALLDVHRIGLARMKALAEKAGEPGRRIATAWADDPRVAALWSMHEAEEAPAPGEELVQLRVPHDASPPAEVHPEHRCDICGQALPDEHAHMLDREARSLSCVCRTCGPLFLADGAKRRSVSPLAVELSDFRIDDTRWRAFDLPIDLAFFNRAPSGEIVAHYPSPVGTVDAVARAEAWGALERDNPVLSDADLDVNALLVHRLGANREHFLVSIDKCYELAGLLRSRWQGLTGGDSAQRALDDFFGGLRTSASAARR